MTADLLKNFLDSFPASDEERKASCFISLEDGEASLLRDLFQVRKDKCWKFDFIRDANGDDWIYSRKIYDQQFHVVFFNKILGSATLSGV